MKRKPCEYPRQFGNFAGRVCTSAHKLKALLLIRRSLNHIRAPLKNRLPKRSRSCSKDAIVGQGGLGSGILILVASRHQERGNINIRLPQTHAHPMSIRRGQCTTYTLMVLIVHPKVAKVMAKKATVNRRPPREERPVTDSIHALSALRVTTPTVSKDIWCASLSVG